MKIIKEGIQREAQGIACPCGGYADRTICTPEEIKQYNCNKIYECCARAFVCRICKERVVGTAEAPNYD